MWVQCDRPHNGEIANVMRRTRAMYHYAVKNVIKEQNRIKSNRMANAISEGNDRNLWKEVHKLRKTCKSVPNVIDGRTKTEDITDLFSTKFEELYNSVGYDDESIRLLECRIDNLVKSKCTQDCGDNHEGHVSYHHGISINVLKKCVSKMKCDKKEESGIYSNHIINGTDLLYKLLTKLYNGMLIHGVSPNELMVGTMIPLQKDKRNAQHKSDNYRALTLGSIIGKLYDVLLFSNKLQSLSRLIYSSVLKMDCLQQCVHSW